jgi:hypothetical protein
LTALLDGTLTAERLAELAPDAAAAEVTTTYLSGLARRAEMVALNSWHQAMKTCADGVLDSLRDKFDKAATAIEAARSLIPADTDPEAILTSASAATVKSWQSLNSHIEVVSRIGAIAAAFGPRLGQFSQVVEYSLADGFRIDDRALACCNGDLVSDSAVFGRPNAGHRTSPWFRVSLRLNTIGEIRERYRVFAEAEFDRINHPSGRGGRVIDGVIVPDPAPRNPYRQEASV